MTSKDNPRQPEPEGTESFISITAYRDLRESRDLAEREVRRLSARAVGQDRQRRELEEHITSLTKRVTSLLSEVDALEKERDHWHERFNALTAKCSSLTNAFEQERTTLSARNHELANEVMRKDGEIGRMRKENTALRDGLAKADRQLNRSLFGHYIINEPGVYVADDGGDPAALGVTRYPLNDALVFTPAKDWGGSEWVQISRNGLPDGRLTAWCPPQPVHQEIELIVKTSPHLKGTPLRGAPNDLLDPAAGGTLACAACGCPTEDSPMVTGVDPGKPGGWRHPPGDPDVKVAATVKEAVEKIDRLEAWARLLDGIQLTHPGWGFSILKPLDEVQP